MILDNAISRNKNRGRLEIVKDVLSIVVVRVRKTRIMYQANLSYTQLEKYLGVLLERGMVECDDNSCYFITWKGKEFLQMYSDYLERVKKIGDEVDGAQKDKLLLENMCFNNECNSNSNSNSKRMTNRREVVF
jgi:predicted transcriptional regulator